ncbi:MAG TPA: GAP family protein [Candidatus Norongarragalinales archaeon]|jgi:cytochrome c biogenesis protein CcdA|nr:GAP family protein [Candidatus Norongarragalinales archaeon]
MSAIGFTAPFLTTLIGAAMIDSVNPCAIGVMVLLISTVTAMKRKSDLLRIGFIYIAGIYLTYLLAGLGLTYGFSLIPIAVAEYISIGVAFIVLTAGVIEVKDFFWYGQGVSLAIPPEQAKKIHKMAKTVTVPGLLFLGAFVAAVELPCTGGAYLAITNLLSQNFDFTAFLLLLIYNVFYVLPLVIILLLAYFGQNIVDIKRWKQETRPYLRLGIGLMLIALSWVLMLIANGTWNIG